MADGLQAALHLDPLQARRSLLIGPICFIWLHARAGSDVQRASTNKYLLTVYVRVEVMLRYGICTESDCTVSAGD